MSKIKVIFRRVKDTSEIVAIFPEINWNAYGDLMSYQHIGQHGGAAWDWIKHETKVATPEEYNELKQELEGLGYDLIIGQCLPKRPK